MGVDGRRGGEAVAQQLEVALLVHLPAPLRRARDLSPDLGELRVVSLPLPPRRRRVRLHGLRGRRGLRLVARVPRAAHGAEHLAVELLI